MAPFFIDCVHFGSYIRAMAQTPEKRVKNKVVALLKQHGAYYFFPATHGFGRSGVPDVVGCLNGYFFAVECKAGTNKPTQLQQRELVAIGAAGGRALVINENNLDELADLLRYLAAYDSNDSSKESKP